MFHQRSLPPFCAVLALALVLPVLGHAASQCDAPPAKPPVTASAAQFEAPVANPSPTFAAIPFKAIELGESGLLEPGVAVFYPHPLGPASAPLSPPLLQRPSIRQPLPATWSLRPVFSSGGEFHRAHFPLAPDVDLYGGGEVTGPLRRNGRSIALWNTDNYRYQKDAGRRLYQSHPWILGVRPDGSAFGLLFDSSWKAELDCTDGVRFTAQGPAFPVLVIDRPTVEAVLEALGALTGRMELPPLWALGYQQCRWSYAPAERVTALADEFRRRRLPCDVLWMDIDYMDGFRVFTFDPKGFPSPRAVNDHLHRLGFKSVWMIDPGIKVDPAYRVYAEGSAAGHFVRDRAGAEYHGDVWPGPCAFPDFTVPAVRSWWAGIFPEFIATGIDGVWNDMNEPAVFKGPDGTMPEDNPHRGGGELAPGNHRQYHNLYGMLMARATREGILAASPDRRPFVLTRANFLGGQRYAATWTGDNSSTEAHMKLSVPMSLSLGLSGQPFNGPDLGGFTDNASPELWAQWVGFGTLFPFARGHAAKGTNDKEPWAFGPAVEQTARIALERRYRLLPYLYTLFREASLNGLPVMRPIFMADPLNPALRREEAAFLLGRDLLVVPAWAEKPALPAGDWPAVSLIDGDRADAAQATLRLRPGAIVPLGKVIQNTTEPSLDPLTLLVCLDPSGRAQGNLYEDAGDGFSYRDGDYRLTTFTARREGDSVRVMVAGSKGARPLPARTIRVRIVTPVSEQQYDLPAPATP